MLDSVTWQFVSTTAAFATNLSVLMQAGGSCKIDIVRLVLYDVLATACIQVQFVIQHTPLPMPRHGQLGESRLAYFDSLLINWSDSGLSWCQSSCWLCCQLWSSCCEHGHPLPAVAICTHLHCCKPVHTVRAVQREHCDLIWPCEQLHMSISGLLPFQEPS